MIQSQITPNNCREGPNEIHVRSVDVLLAVNGAGSKCSKGVSYDPLDEKGEYPLAVTRDKIHHKHRRQVWEKAFSTKGNVHPLSKSGLTNMDSS